MSEVEKLQLIKDEYARDEKERPLAHTLDDVPAFYECITPEWLTAVVQRRHPGAVVISYDLDERDTGTTNRRRIFLHYARDDPAFPKSLFCKAAQELANRITMSVGSAVGETRFYNDVRPKLGIDAPQSYFAKVAPRSFRAIIVLEDLAQEVEFCSFATPMNRARVESQLELLAAFHGRFYEADDLKGWLSDFDTFPARFRRMAEYHGLADACDRGLMAAEGVVPNALIARRAEIWPKTMASLDPLTSQPQALTHGDVHLGNWYVRANDKMGLADFQNVTRAHWSRDVAYAISTSLDVEDRRRWERELVAFYLDALARNGGAREDFDTSWRNYRQQMLTVLAYWTVTLTPSPTMSQHMQTEETTLSFLRRIGHAIEDLETLDAFG